MTPVNRWLFRVKVSGGSMLPELVPGRIYWATGLLPLRVGDRVVFKNPDNVGEIYVKKITAVHEGIYSVRGTVPASSSHEVPAQLVLGRILFG